MADSNSKQWDAETIERELARGIPPMETRRLPPAVKLGEFGPAIKIVTDKFERDIVETFEGALGKNPGEA